MKESFKYVLLILFLLLSILAIGTGGYYLIEDGWSLGDAFYMTVITITTVGFSEIHELSPQGRFFTVAIIFVGFGTVAFSGAQFARLILENIIKGVLGRKKMETRIGKMKEHYVVCGHGTIGSSICSELEKRGFLFVVIEIKEERITFAEKKGYYVVKGNATTDSSLKEAGVERASGVIAALTDDADNLFISLAARELNPKIMIVSRGEGEGVEDRILRAGADVVVSPLKLGGQQIARLITEHIAPTSPAPMEEQLTNVLGFSLRVFRHSEETIITIDKAVKKAKALRAVAVKHENGTVENDPEPNMEISGHDSVIMLVRDGSLPEINIHPQVDAKKILLVDDHRALRLLFSRKIRSAGHEVITAGNGEEALNLAIRQVPDLIVLDVVMPGKDGFEVCKIIKQKPELKKIPIILFSADKTKEFIDKGRDAGADACLRKTSKSTELLAKIEEMITTHTS